METPPWSPSQRLLGGLANGALLSTLFVPMFVLVQGFDFDNSRAAPYVIAFTFLLPVVIRLAARPVAPSVLWLQGVPLALLPAMSVLLIEHLFPDYTSPYGFAWVWGPVLFVVAALVLRVAALPKEARAEQVKAYLVLHLMLFGIVAVMSFYVFFALPWG